MINKQFKYLEQLEDGWHDGYGKKPSALSIELGIKILANLGKNIASQVFIFPLDSENGGVFIEWFNQEYAISVDIDSDGKTNFCYLDLLKREEHFDIDFDYGSFDEQKIANYITKYVDKHTII